MFISLRNAFLSGIVVLSPLAVTVWVIHFLVNWLGAFLSPVLIDILHDDLKDNFWIRFTIKIVSAFLVVVIITTIGWLSRRFFGKMLFKKVEQMIANVPIVKTVYGTVRQIIDTFSQQKKAVFQKAILVEFPRKGLYSVGFLTSESSGEVQFRTDQVVINAFIPTTPNPTSGFLVMVPKSEIIELDMSIGDAMKLIISGGAVVPQFDPETKRTVAVHRDPSDASAPSAPTSIE
ncbi:MAG: DUF502 domain-containing protein [Verrucomicrobiota bacterium]|nr:DUF502 domain-containing protein [Verrucomicrobiota bacterium]